MKEFYVDFSGYLTIKANDATEAENKFWQFVNELDFSGDISNDVWDIDYVEEFEESDS